MDKSWGRWGEAVNLRSYGDLSSTIRNVSLVDPNDFDLIVGIPRSGLLVGLMLGMAWRKPVTDLDGLSERRVLKNGSTTENLPQLSVDFDVESLRILLVDDSCHTGSSLMNAKSKVLKSLPDCVLKSLCVYVSPRSKLAPDYFYEVLKPHHVFEWNFGRNMVLEQACLDIDGVLCPDPPVCETRDPDAYGQYLGNAPILLKTHREIKFLVTNRLECWRDQTEKWLARNDIQYQHLIMHPASTVEERALRDPAWHKSRVYSNCDALLFVESEPGQAEEIFIRTGKPVLCFESFSFPNGEKEMHKKTTVSVILRLLKKLAPFFDSVGRNGGVSALLRRKVVQKIKKHVL